jgi:hypothetical protein
MDGTDLPYHLVGTELRHKTRDTVPTMISYKGKTYTPNQIKKLLTPKIKMKVLKYGSRYFLAKDSGEIHSTAYTTRDKAQAASLKISAGLLQFQTTITQVLNSNLTNKL